MGKADDKFWNEIFDLGGNLPGLWYEKAIDLIIAADHLGTFKSSPAPFKPDIRIPPLYWEKRSVFVVEAMLLAMATECLLKALWLKYDGRLAKDGSYTGVLTSSDPRVGSPRCTIRNVIAFEAVPSHGWK